MSKASDIAALMATRLAGVPGVINVFRGKRKLDESELPAIVLFEGEDRIKDETKNELVKIEQYYGAEWHGPCDPDNPNDAAHVAIADIKKALFIRRDPSIGQLFSSVAYRGRSIGPREDSADTVSCIVLFSVIFPEDLTNP